MSDIVDKATRSRMMSGIRGKDTKPELVIRKALFSKGYRYRLHDRKLPGRPDIVFPKYRAIVFIHGCFWHGHDCHLFKWPETRKEFWHNKINCNRENDKKHNNALINQGWRILTTWECAIKGKTRLSPEKVINSISVWLEKGKRNKEIMGK